MVHGNAPRRRSPLHLAGIALLLAFGVAGLSQCRTVSEPLAGADLSISNDALHGRRSCQANCNQRYRHELEKEQARFEEALKKCDGDRECRQEAREYHRGIVTKLRMEKAACKRACYNEGSGSTSR
jgi:hypothetical protein